ncbi:MAG: hypothetical protein IPK19_39355 [Chloroflexi bacterium]|nr:hypothetical protein [Chloroflexota bacterium]
MAKVRKSVIVLWEPLAMLVVGVVLMSISFTSPSIDWILNIAGSLILLGAAIGVMISISRKL